MHVRRRGREKLTLLCRVSLGLLAIEFNFAVFLSTFLSNLLTKEDDEEEYSKKPANKAKVKGKEATNKSKSDG